MNSNENEFEDMIGLYDEIKDFKVNMSIEILSGYRSHHCRSENFEEGHITDRLNEISKFDAELSDFCRSNNIRDYKNCHLSLSERLNKLLDEDLIGKLQYNKLKSVILIHSNILYYILNNENFDDAIKKRLINRIIIEHEFGDYVIKRFKFKLSNLNEEDYRFSLSSTTICTHAFAKYIGFLAKSSG